jgi:hypothetical protein
LCLRGADEQSASNRNGESCLLVFSSHSYLLFEVWWVAGLVVASKSQSSADPHRPNYVDPSRKRRGGAGSAAALRKGGLYVLGLHLTPPRGKPEADEESWAAQRGQLCVLSKMWSTGVDRKKRREGVGMCFDVYTPTRTFRLANHCDFRTYSAAQMQALITASRAFEVVDSYDFAYEIDEPVVIDSKTEDVIYVLRRK